MAQIMVALLVLWPTAAVGICLAARRCRTRLHGTPTPVRLIVADDRPAVAVDWAAWELECRRDRMGGAA